MAENIAVKCVLRAIHEEGRRGEWEEEEGRERNYQAIGGRSHEGGVIKEE